MPRYGREPGGGGEGGGWDRRGLEPTPRGRFSWRQRPPRGHTARRRRAWRWRWWSWRSRRWLGCPLPGRRAAGATPAGTRAAPPGGGGAPDQCNGWVVPCVALADAPLPFDSIVQYMDKQPRLQQHGLPRYPSERGGGWPLWQCARRAGRGSGARPNETEGRPPRVAHTTPQLEIHAADPPRGTRQSVGATAAAAAAAAAPTAWPAGGKGRWAAAATPPHMRGGEGAPPASRLGARRPHRPPRPPGRQKANDTCRRAKPRRRPARRPPRLFPPPPPSGWWGWRRRRRPLRPSRPARAAASRRRGCHRPPPRRPTALAAAGGPTRSPTRPR
ncbi:hypothetical protein I4F81_012215 [Pyropia yezoensis]|uniref:Uncharacterized protein n=1 Tax=Pyropia yezoensis TaxID=2788 RepID=A0ACC3CHH3_PYRYE|nr:hypothetical protein I4F81_012215 [Neopyropia yezoensis]